MANIVNTPITMYVKEHNLELYGDSITELMEYNSYPVKIYSDEELEGCHLVKRHQNSQQLVSVGELKKDVRRLYRSENNDSSDSTKRAWWIFLENLNEQDDEGKPLNTYGGVLKTYEYERIPTVISNVDRISDYNIVELGIIKGTFNSTFSEFTVADDFKDEIPSSGVLKTDFLDIPLPLNEQTEIKIPEALMIEEIEIEISDSETISLSSLKLENISYDEEEGYYYYQTNLNIDEGRTGIITCKVSENNFSNYSINVELFLNVLGEEEILTYSYDEIDNLTLKWGNIESENFEERIEFEERPFDLTEVLLNETSDDYSNVYTLYSLEETSEPIEFYSDRYNGAGLNELLLGIRKQVSGKTEYVTNSISLTVIPSIESDSWFVPIYNIKRAYLGIPEKEEDTETIENFKNQYDVYYPQEVDSLYIDMKNYNLKDDKIIELKAYTWNPNTGYFELASDFITLSEQGKPTSGTEEGAGDESGGVEENPGEEGGSGGEVPVEPETT